MRTIICENSAGTRLTFPAGRSAEPFLLSNATGVLEAKAQMLKTESGSMDGAILNGSRMEARNIVLTLRDAPGADHEANRLALFTLFKFRDEGTLTFISGERRRQIAYYVESVTADISKASHTYTVSLLCPSPYFEDTTPGRVTVGGVVGGFTFPHVFTPVALGGECFGSFGTSRVFTVENASASDEIGLTITLTAQGGAVRNPRFTHIQAGETLALGSAALPLILSDGESITITTGRGEKRALDENGNSLLAYLTEDSEFITLRRGTNTITCSAQGGNSNIYAVFSWRLRYEGA